MTLAQRQRYWSKVKKRGADACWPWTGCRNSKGYGQVWCPVTARSEQAHRVAFYLTHHNWPPVVMHRCDNPPCCNPAHLMSGTNASNNADKLAKGRHVMPRQPTASERCRGPRHHSAKLTLEQVAEIRQARPNETLASLAQRFGVHLTAIHKIVTGRSWKQV